MLCRLVHSRPGHRFHVVQSAAELGFKKFLCLHVLEEHMGTVFLFCVYLIAKDRVCESIIVFLHINDIIVFF